MEAAIFREQMPEAEVVISGVGMAATAATLVSLYASGKLSDDRCVVLAGIAGHYADSVAKGEVVVIEESFGIRVTEIIK